MSHTYTRNLVHCVFSTKERRPLIPSAVQLRLWKFMAAVARERNIHVLEIGGTENHVHILLALPATLALATAVQAIKGVSSKWMNEDMRGFAWQQGYGAFSVCNSQLDRTVAYLRNQSEHHAKVSFEVEFIAFLKKNGVDYDPQYVLG